MSINPYEPPKEEPISRSVGRRHRIGFLMVVLGALLMLMTTRISFLRWRDMGEETLNRVIVFSTLGGVLIVAGIIAIAWQRRPTPPVI